MIMDLQKKIKRFYEHNSIDRLMTDKVDDFILLEEKPRGIRIGKKLIFVGNLTLENEGKFFESWAKIVSALGAKILNMEIANERRKELLEKADFYLLANGKYMMEFLMMDKFLIKELCKLIKKTVLKQQNYYFDGFNVKILKWYNCSYRYFKKNVTKEQLIEICFLVYLYNFDSVKKNVQILVEKMNMKQLSEIYMYSWLRNLSGLTGKFLLAQAPSIDYAFRDSSNKKHQKKEKKNDGNT